MIFELNKWLWSSLPSNQRIGYQLFRCSYIQLAAIIIRLNFFCFWELNIELILFIDNLTRLLNVELSLQNDARAHDRLINVLAVLIVKHLIQFWKFLLLIGIYLNMRRRLQILRLIRLLKWSIMKFNLSCYYWFHRHWEFINLTALQMLVLLIAELGVLLFQLWFSLHPCSFLFF